MNWYVLTHIYLFAELSWLFQMRIVRQDQRGLVVGVQVPETVEGIRLAVMGARGSQTGGWLESVAHASRSAAQRLYKTWVYSSLNFIKSILQVKQFKGCSKFIPIYSWYIYQLTLKTLTWINTVELSIIHHFKLLYQRSSTYLIALGTRLVSNLNKELSNNIVMSLGTSSLSCRQVFSLPANVAMSGRLL